jgi:hypothetical protein
LSVTSVGDSVLSVPFYLNDVLVAPDFVQSLFSVCRFTTDNSCSMEFDPFVLFVKDLATRRLLAKYDSTGSLYTLPLPTSTTPTLRVVPYALATAAFSATCHRCLGHPNSNVLSKLSSSSAITCPQGRAEMIPCTMPTSLVDTFGCSFLAPLLESFNPLTSYIVTFGPPLFRVSLVTSITWSSSMTAPTTRELFCCARSLTSSPPSPTSSPLCPHSLAAPSRTSSVIMDASLITPPHFLPLSRRPASHVVSLHFPAEWQGRAHDSYHQRCHALPAVSGLRSGPLLG